MEDLINKEEVSTSNDSMTVPTLFPPVRLRRKLLRRTLSASLLGLFPFFSATTEAATLLGHQVQSGGTLDMQFPLSDYFQRYAAEGGNPRPTAGHALLFFPKGFDPSRPWPILIVTSTTDFACTSIMDAPWYRDAAMKEGWVVLATDANIRPNADSLQWRLAPLTAGLQMIRNEWPQSAQWPIAFAGLSGGAKRSGILAAMLAKNHGLRICGLFLAGISSDRVTAGYKDYQPPTDFLNVPIWISSGTADQVATVGAQENVYYSLKRTGFKEVRLERFFGGHGLRSAEIQRALHWFREVGRF
ncbi:MAG TPA: hypothetical protein VM717_02060 [Chthoniobacterales bacterium]|nr:hypothetical protein [Chthoniobacterales bacterium]